MSETTDMAILGIRTEVRVLLKEGREAAKAATAEAVKAADKAASEAVKKIDQRVAALEGARSRGPAVIAVLGVLFVILLAYAVGWAMGHAGVSVSALLGI